MSEHMKKPHTESIAMVTWHGAHYALPVGIIEKYRVKEESKTDLSIDDVFGDLINEHGEPGLLLKGLRHREGLNQIELAKILNISQTNLSAMENGRRAIGKELAKRIGEKFKIDYRNFL
ncbi:MULTISPECIES: helix-turn-helix domain-containing protein [Legionella]|uniref:Antitoxin PezA n=1 Tax=Legionella drozanskii LLAP-1 TaxID=1212489 RepID=A0A0W0SM62_9GAMM|nr:MULTISPECIES: helix-turn-helix transcriptional regulator [Legionella]KTC84440.1 Antitoxin PezA [Legionella drozanskii LLAP-1]PJE06665.1 MAG: XRE family transcriptional regulator [Legionella sp.]